jgi:probable H4MPT-linked C1 transfer pathway protein
MKRVLGLDVGGANLKAAHVDGSARLRPFALWMHPHKLRAALRSLLGELPAFDLLALTMTGELCDCYTSSRQGVLAILDAVTAAAGSCPVRVWQRKGGLVSADEAREDPLRVAAANWLALATYAGRFVRNGAALLLDVGSTTTDLIPLASGRPVPLATGDAQRVRCRELVYTGVRRTPVCALVHGCVAAELFATTLDVYLMLGDVPEDGGTDTADGRPATRAGAHGRLARMLCGDAETCTVAQTRRLAERAALAQGRLLRRALRRVTDRFAGPPRTIILAGSGEFLARQLVRAEPAWSPRVISLARRLGPELSSAACAYAVAILAAEANHG